MTRRDNPMFALRALLIAAFVVCALPALHDAGAQAAQEVIKSYVSDITVEPDGDLSVRETITVHAAGYQIKRGIYRDFPTVYPGPYGLKEKVGFDIVEVLRDGNPEPYFTQSVDNGVRIYIGDEAVFLPEGDYTYTIVYTTDRQLRFDEGFDELYWNVTGNDWAFPILQAEARITLPDGAEPIDRAAYTGAFGDTGQDYKTSILADGTIVFATTKMLAAHSGFTVAVSWPKGFVTEPGGAAKASGLIGDNLGIVVGLVGLILTIVYFLIFWNRIGRDPDKGLVIPLFDPPEKMPPVVVGYASNWGFGMRFSRARAFAVAITSMAVKGAVTIDANEDDSFTITGTGEPASELSPGEKAVWSHLFAGTSSSVTLSRTYNPAISNVVDLLANLIRKDYTNVYFRMNRGAWFAGAVLATASAAIAAVVDARTTDDVITVGMLAVFGLAFGFGAAAMWVRLGTALATALRRSTFKFIATLVGGVAAALFSIPALGAIAMSATLVSLPVIVVMVLNAAIVFVFWFLMKAPTMHGRKVMDEIEGYKLYLSVAESDRMNMLGAEPRMTEQIFERHLPYAMALGVEEPWTEHFEAQIPPEQAQQGSYGPRWYRSSGRVSSLSSMASTLSSGLSSTISSASTRPSSSSSGGSSGGGSSGGGGGGGGGGGW